MQAKNRRDSLLVGILSLLLVGAVALPVVAQQEGGDEDFTASEWDDMSWDDLEEMDVVVVTSVSKKAQKATDAAAAIYVITRDDIDRSSAQTIPELLRMVPGVQVNRVGSSEWAVTVRGFNGEFSNKLLVLFDGRTVYTPFFAGVYWDIQDYPLEDLDRIEIIRGPGATVWGANAVNGVINIITKHAKESQGGLLSVASGDYLEELATLRYGGKLGDETYYRVYGKYTNRDHFDLWDDDLQPDDSAHDDWDMMNFGFRFDTPIDENDDFMASGQVYQNDKGAFALDEIGYQPPYRVPVEETVDSNGWHLLSSWDHTFSETSQSTLQVYFDRYQRKRERLDENRDTYDVDFQHTFQLGQYHSFVWGLGYRYTEDQMYGTFAADVTNRSQVDHTYSAFIQDEIELIKNKLRLTLGSKFEHNDYTEFEVQPSARLAWMPNDAHTFWAAISRAVRTPSRGERSLTFNFLYGMQPLDLTGDGAPDTTVPVFMAARGAPDYDEEELIAYELGWRWKFNKQLNFDLALFYNDYDDLRTRVVGAPELVIDPGTGMPLAVNLPHEFTNESEGEGVGGEFVAEWKPTEWLKLVAGYSYIDLDLDTDSNAPSAEMFLQDYEKEAPEHQFHVRAYVDLPGDFQLDTFVNYMDELEPNAVDIDDHVRLDVRLGWQPMENLEIELVGRDLLDPEHIEYNTLGIQGEKEETERNFYGQVTYHF